MAGSGATYLASIFGTERDKVNCSFYLKIGACRHGDRCSRQHIRPTVSNTILLTNLYQNPANEDGCTMNEQELQQHFDEFYEDVWWELEEKYGEIEEMNICDNLGDHLVGNVYIMFKDDEAADRAVADLNNRWFNGRPITADLSPVTDFREACCRQYEKGDCGRGGYCNFMHLRPISRELSYRVYGTSEPPSKRREARGGGGGGGRGGFGGRGGGGGGWGRDRYDDRGGGGFGRDHHRRDDRGGGYGGYGGYGGGGFGGDRDPPPRDDYYDRR